MMKEALIHSGPRVEIVDSPIPTPDANQVVTKVVVSGSNPKDWKRAAMPSPNGKAINQGDDIAGIVHSVGSDVLEFKPGDRVAAFHQLLSPGGSYAEYAVSPAHTTFHIPKKTTFEVNVYFPLIHPGGSTEAATIPLAAMTAAVGLYQRLSLPLPWHPTTTPLPLLIYGAATAVGSFAVQLAQQSNIHPLICIAGRGTKHVEGMIDKSKGDIVLDYRNVNLVQNIKDAVSETSTGKLEYAFDAVSEKGSFQNICKALDHTTGQITLVLPGRDYSDIPSTIRSSGTLVGCVHKATDPDKWQKTTGTSVGNEDFGFIFYRLFSRGLQQGWLKPHPFEVVPGGLGGVEGALRNLKEGNASAVKYVFRIADTEGLERNKLWKWSGV